MTASYKVRLLKRRPVADNTMAFYLEKPDGFGFIPGQNIDVGLIDHDIADPNDSARAFSLASAPHEDHLMIIARMRNNQYKNALNNLRDGDRLEIYGPYGSFHLHNDPDIPAVFIIGGIGITPCLSILTHEAWQRSRRTLYLFYSNRKREDATCLDVLIQLQKDLPHFRCIPTLTAPLISGNGWKHETGRIDYNMISRHVPDPHEAKYYIVGPSRMVWPMVQHLDGIIARANMLVEDFTGF